MAKLTREQIARLQAALVEGFSRSELARLARFGLDENLADIAGGATTADIVFNLITWTERQGRVQDLVDAALTERPANDALRALAGELSAAPPDSRSQADAAPSGAPPGGSWSIGEIHAVNVSLGDQTVDQREAEISVGDSKVDTGGGAYVAGNVTVSGGDFVGRDKTVKGDDGRPDTSKTFARLAASLALQTPAAEAEQATRLVTDMQEAFERGDDVRMAECIGSLAKLAPSVLESLKATLSQPPLRGRIGPITIEALREV